MNISAIWKWIWERKRVLIIGTCICALVLLAFSCIFQDKTYQIRVSYVYRGSENGLYPDGHRLLRDDLIDIDRINEALEAMRSKGWYEDISAEKIQKNLSVREFLTNPVQDRVQTLRAQGEAYTYYNNEFIITFTQPVSLHLKDSSDFFGFFRDDRSKEFVDELVKAVLLDFSESHTEGDIFTNFANYMQIGDADYSKIVDAYNDKVDLCVNYLYKKNATDSTFVSDTTGLSFDDLIIAYQSLKDVQISRLDKFASSGKVTRSLDELINQFEVDIENQNLVEKKKLDESSLAKNAMLEYDHTFSENIIIVSVNEENGLYQARPKTAYDTVTQRSLDAGVAASLAKNAADNKEQLITEYSASMSSGNASAKVAEAEELVADVYAEYDRLCQLSSQTIRDYQNEIYNNYIKTTAVDNSSEMLMWAIKLCIFLVLGLCLSCAVCLLSDRRRAKRDASERG